jgi:glycosyltransferase involved in cell wall biosynthesis
MKVLALTFGDDTCASSQYRIFQYRETLAQQGISLETQVANSFEDWDSLGAFDVVIVQKRLFGGRIVRRLRRRSRRLVYDVDDAVWLPHDEPHHWFTQWRVQRRLESIASVADLCITANELLRAKLSAYSRNVCVLPMALSADEWPYESADKGGRVRVGWIGSPANLRYLEAIEEDLTQVQKLHPQVEFVVFCGAKPKFLNGLQYTHVPFEPKRLPAVARSLNVGLLPLPDNDFAAGKSPIKALQYMASGVVTVASPVGATRDMILEDIGGLFANGPGEWRDTVALLAGDPDLRRRLRKSARLRFEECFSLERAAERLAQLLKGLT